MNKHDLTRSGQNEHRHELPQHHPNQDAQEGHQLNGGDDGAPDGQAHPSADLGWKTANVKQILSILHLKASHEALTQELCDGLPVQRVDGIVESLEVELEDYALPTGLEKNVQ